MRRFAILYLLSLGFLPGSTTAQASDGWIFGFKIGNAYPQYSAEDLVQEVIGLPYIVTYSDSMAKEFSSLQLIVTPISGTIIGMRGIANFEAEGDARSFANRLSYALEARFGKSRYCFFEIFEHNFCFGRDDVKPELIGLRDSSIYFAFIESYELEVRLFDASITGGGQEVQLSFGPSSDSALAGELLELFALEAAQFNERISEETVERERSGVLLGID